MAKACREIKVEYARVPLAVHNRMGNFIGALLRLSASSCSRNTKRFLRTSKRPIQATFNSPVLPGQQTIPMLKTFTSYFTPNGPPGPNHGAYLNKRYDELYLKSKYMANGPERYAVFKEMAEILKDDVPFFTHGVTDFFGLYQLVGNMKRHMMIDAPFQFFNIDTVMKQKLK